MYIESNTLQEPQIGIGDTHIIFTLFIRLTFYVSKAIKDFLNTLRFINCNA